MSVQAALEVLDKAGNSTKAVVGSEATYVASGGKSC